MGGEQGEGELEPPAYLSELSALLQTTEPELWSFFVEAGRDQALGAEARQELLRSGYRLDATAHPELVAAAELVAERLGIGDEVTLYQAHDGGSDGANAQIVSLPGEAHVLFSGRLLELLGADELLAVLGHELAHHLLWARGDGEHWVLDRLVHAAAVDLAAAPVHAETARLVRLNTELFADRGSLTACEGDLPVAVAALVKASTGLREVSGVAYLQQAAEVVAAGSAAARTYSHPELFVRAWALQQWAQAGSQVDEEVAARLAGPVDLDRLDLVAQRRAATDVCALIGRFLHYPWARTDTVVGHARLFDEGAVPSAKSTDMPPPLPPVREPGLVDLFAYILLDLATVDPDVEAPALAAAMVLSEEIGIAKRFDALVAKELGFAAKSVRVRRADAAATLAAAT